MAETFRPLHTAQDMYDYCKTFHMGTGTFKSWSMKHLSVIEDEVKPNEYILTVFIGLCNGFNSAYAITSERMIIAKKNLIGCNVRSISLKFIKNISLRKDLLHGYIQVDTIKEQFTVSVLKGCADAIYECIHTALKMAAELSSSKNQTPKTFEAEQTHIQVSHDCPNSHFQDRPQQPDARLSYSLSSDRTSSVPSCPHSSDYVILDTETTGLSPYTDEIIQISAIRYNAQGTPYKFFDTLLKPYCLISPSITQINGISNQMVADAPRAHQIQDEFLSFLGDALLVGYNVTFDLRFLNQTFPEFFTGRSYVDALTLSRRALTLPSYKLEAVASEVGFCPDGVFHDSFTDCEAVAAILRHIETDLDSQVSKFNTPTARSHTHQTPAPQEHGLVLWRQGEALRKEGRFEEAIQLYDRAREEGYTNPALYESYAMAYRRAGKLEEEIAILEEGFRHYPHGPISENFLNRKAKAQERLAARLRREEALRIKEEERSRKAEERRLRQELEAARPKQAVRRAVLQCSDDGTVLKEFNSLTDASRETGVSTKCIRECANGRQKHAGGYCWKFPAVCHQMSDTPESDTAQNT